MPHKPSLEAYRKKRQAGQTPEPFGAVLAPTPRFVVQKHAARREHYDFRLEWRGVLWSWAVPRVPSHDPAVKRLAVHVEDHPTDYALFEGTIPPGNYGAGNVIVWDTGAWLPHEDPDGGIERGKLLFELHGYKLRGVWTLVRSGKRGAGNEWLLIKKPDGFARPDDVQPDVSVLSGLSVEAVSRVADISQSIRREVASLGLPAATARTKLGMMLAQTGDKPFDDPAWIFELKYDGYRMLARRDGNDVQLFYRRGADATQLYPEVARALLALPETHFVLDGELVAHDAAGMPSFGALQERAQLQRAADIVRASVERPTTLYTFDILVLGEVDVRSLPLLHRKQLLQRLAPALGPLRFADHVVGAGEKLFAEVQKRELEGLVAKRADSPYRTGRSAAWLKLPVHQVADFAVVGFSAPRGTRSGLGALQLARREDDAWHYAGAVGTGMDAATLHSLRALLEPLARAKPVCREVPKALKGVTWVTPSHLCVVRFKELTRDGHVRQAVYLRLRDQKSGDDLPEAHVAPVVDKAPPPPRPAPVPKTVPFTNLDKVFWPETGQTKGDLIAYYRAVAPAILPYLKDRPLVLTRFPDGINGKSFFQKDAPKWVPSWLRTQRMWSEHAERDIDYFVCDDVEGLLYVINMGTIPLHIWSSRVQTLGKPDWCILDLDPKGAPFTDVVAIARAIRRLCIDADLPCYAKTSGSTGLHVLIPTGGALTFEQTRTLAYVLARIIADKLPKIATLERVIGARQGRVYIDFLQNGHGRLLVAPWSARPVPGALVSTPLDWREVTTKLDFHRFDLERAPTRAQRRDPMREILTASVDVAKALQRLAAVQS